jgi:hypothetical protein
MQAPVHDADFMSTSRLGLHHAQIFPDFEMSALPEVRAQNARIGVWPDARSGHNETGRLNGGL